MIAQLVNRPIFVDETKKQIHQMWDSFKVRWDVSPYVNWLFAITSAELRNVRNCSVVQ